MNNLENCRQEHRLLPVTLAAFPEEARRMPRVHEVGAALFQGDCDWWAAQLPPGSVDCICTDLSRFYPQAPSPAEELGATAMASQNRRTRVNEPVFDLEQLLDCDRCLKPGGVMWIWGNQRSNSRLGFELMSIGFTGLKELVWMPARTVSTLLQSDPAVNHPSLLFAYKDPDFDPDAACSDATGDVEGELPSPPRILLGKDWNLAPVSYATDSEAPSLKMALNELPDLLTQGTNTGDVILDPFCGSGDVGVAALRARRNFIGIEQDMSLLRIAAFRLSPGS